MILASTLILLFGWTSAVHAIKQKPSMEAKDFPAVVRISARNTRTGRAAIASGVLIANNVVLTAAHCVAPFDSWEVIAPYAKGGSSKSTSKTGRVYPKYHEGEFENDVGVLILDRPIEIEGKFPSLRAELLPLDAKMIAAGCTTNAKPCEAKLYIAETSVAQFPDNVNVYGGLPQVAEAGDSGGPLFVTKDGASEVVAVISGHIGFSRRNVPLDVFVPIAGKTKDWVQEQLPKKK